MSHDMVAAAYIYASRGMKIFPVWWAQDGQCACSAGPDCSSPAKHPLVPRWEQVASAHSGDMSNWWQRWPDANIGLPAGINNLAIIDVDPAHGGDENLTTLARWVHDRTGTMLYDTLTVRTGSGGTHLYYQAPEGGIKTAARSFRLNGIDTRGGTPDGHGAGYVVAPPSLHVSGGRYETVYRVWPPAPWPAILTWAMEFRYNPPRPAAGGNAAPAAGYNPDRITRRLHAWALAGYQQRLVDLRNLPAGAGHNKIDTLNRTAYNIGLRLALGILPGITYDQALQDILTATSGWQSQPRGEIIRHTLRAFDQTRSRGHELALPRWAAGWNAPARPAADTGGNA